MSTEMNTFTGRCACSEGVAAVNSTTHRAFTRCDVMWGDGRGAGLRSRRIESIWRAAARLVCQLKAISQKFCSVLNTMGPQIQWVHSYVTGDQIHCIYRAPNEAMVREHASLAQDANLFAAFRAATL